jgi:hypothetical protein
MPNPNTHLKIFLETDCTQTSQAEWNNMMQSRRRFSYRKLVSIIRYQCPELYEGLGLKFPNEFNDKTWRTPTHLILTHSAIEYFFRIM